MFKKISGMLVIGAVLVGCDNSQPVGGQGYFDAPQPAPLPEFTQPVSLVPTTPAPTDDMTESLNNALTEAINATPIDGTEVEVAEIPTETPPSDTISTDDGTLNLNITSQAQQVIEREEAARILEAARAQLVVIEPGTLPTVVAGVNIAEFARTTTNEVGEKLYRRPVIKNRFSSTECRKFRSADDAQRYFLANGGPQKDPLNLDPDGDGFACRWSPEHYRLLQ